MSDKELALNAIRRLPASATMYQIQNRVAFLAALKEGEEALARGERVPHTEVKRQLKSWVKSWHSKSSGLRAQSKTSAK